MLSTATGCEASRQSQMTPFHWQPGQYTSPPPSLDQGGRRFRHPDEAASRRRHGDGEGLGDGGRGTPGPTISPIHRRSQDGSLPLEETRITRALVCIRWNGHQPALVVRCSFAKPRRLSTLRLGAALAAGDGARANVGTYFQVNGGSGGPLRLGFLLWRRTRAIRSFGDFVLAR